jgi:hypothetical protein
MHVTRQSVLSWHPVGETPIRRDCALPPRAIRESKWRHCVIAVDRCQQGSENFG